MGIDNDIDIDFDFDIDIDIDFDIDIVPGTSPKTYFVGKKGEEEWRMPDLFIFIHSAIGGDSLRFYIQHDCKLNDIIEAADQHYRRCGGAADVPTLRFRDPM